MATHKLSMYRTRILHDDDATRVIYHSTVIVKFDTSTIKLSSGGYETVTTKRKMNQASNQFGLGFSVFQKNFDWFVTTSRGETFPFVDGMSFERSAFGQLTRPARRYA